MPLLFDQPNYQMELTVFFCFFFSFDSFLMNNRHDRKHPIITWHHKLTISIIYGTRTKPDCSWTLKKKMRMTPQKRTAPIVILPCQKRITCAQSVVDIYRREHSIAKFASNALLSGIITAFGWIAVSVNRITNTFWPDVCLPHLLLRSVPICQ